MSKTLSADQARMFNKPSSWNRTGVIREPVKPVRMTKVQDPESYWRGQAFNARWFTKLGG